MKFRSIIITAMLAGAVQPAAGASSAWHEVEGGKVRIVSAGLPDGDGNLRGAIEIELRPGWKTYWRDPGEAGIPPQIDISRSLNVSAAAIGFPPPDHFDDGYASWAGYAHSVSLPVSFTVPQPDAATIVTADILLGICESICIPVNAQLEFDPLAGADDVADAMVVEAAFASLPAASHAGFEVVSSQADGGYLTVEVDVPDGDAALFLVAPDAWRLGSAKLVAKSGSRLTFRVKVADRPAAGPGAFSYTLRAGAEAVDGRFSVP